MTTAPSRRARLLHVARPGDMEAFLLAGHPLFILKTIAHPLRSSAAIRSGRVYAAIGATGGRS